MVATSKIILKHLQEVTTELGAGAGLSEEEIRALVWFLHYGQNVYSQSGRDWTGATFRQRETTCLLVAKSRLGDIPQVVFVTDRTPVGCILAFAKQWEADTLTWVPDKYA